MAAGVYDLVVYQSPLQNIAACKLLFFVKNNNGTQKAVVGDGKVAM